MKPEPPPPASEQEAKEREISQDKLKSAKKPRTRVIIAPSTDPGPDVQISSR